MRCTRCGERSAEYKRPYAGDAVCGRCLVGLVRDRVFREIRRWRWFRPGQRIVVALSGGKDSSLALRLVTEYVEPLPDIEVIALTVDEGIPEFREACIWAAERVADELEVEHEVVSFEEEYGFALEEVVEDVDVPACTLCGVLRRRLLNRRARELGADVVVTGHNLDDEAQAALMNFVKADLAQLARLHPEVRPEDGLIVPRVKPLRRVLEREVRWVAEELGLPFHADPCPYAHSSVRSFFREILDEMEERIPDVKFGLVRALDRAGPVLAEEFLEDRLGRCERCGEPAAGDICKACELLERVGLV
ncbi:TIGR00269 family protein [Methanopyrus sp. KOL6]|uniref:TIGR00269 family protein n=1 Tax=Methanopyrus sp. KOL6 TaxID=1937004 RepID=UPI0012F837F8|nr:TIGR00269 family protein [Methanopyrus sp. KOL6]